MKKAAALISACMFFLCTAIICAPFSYADSGVSKDTSWFDYDDPKTSYTISTEAQLIGLASLVNEEQVDRWKPTRLENFEGVTFTLARDIKLTSAWTPIGKGGASYFAGTFDGNGHTISNIKVKSTSENTGLFGYLAGEVKDLNVKGEVTSDLSSCGGIAGAMTSTASITGCTSSVAVSGTDKCGGIAGFNDGGIVEGCINTGDVSGTHKVGGVVGENWGGRILSCGNRGTVESSRRGVSTYGTGGVAGRSVSAEALISESYNCGEIISYTEATGGITGYMNAKGSAIENCYNTGAITIKKKDNKEEIVDAYAGGIVGIAGTNGVSIINCYNAAATMNADITGGVIGRYINENDEPEPFIFNNYYLKDYYAHGIGKLENTEDPNLTDAAIETPVSAMDSLHSSLSVSYMKDTGEYGNNGFPVLKWQQPVGEKETIYISGIPKDKQQMLDKYLVRTASDTAYGQSIINFFEPDNVMSNAFIHYMEAKDKADGDSNDGTEGENDAAE